MIRRPLVVVGDSLLDVDVEGTADRLSPEAPVAVVDVVRQWRRPGGAGLAALIAAQSHPEVILITGLASDEAGEALLDLLTGQVDVRPLPLRGSTACKTRISAAGVPMLRLDTGDGWAADAPLPQAATDALANAGAILVSDYGRGTTALPVLRELLTERAKAIPVIWDPHRAGATPVPGCTLVTPNAAEAEQFSRRSDPDAQGRRLCVVWHAKAVAVTRGDRVATLTDGTSRETRLIPLLEGPRAARQDTCGAGDQFAAAVAEALLGGADIDAAVQAAVIRAAEYVHAGAAATFSTASIMPSPVVPRLPQKHADALRLAARVRRSGGRLVATGGCFDLLHRGHVDLLERARALGDALIVCLNSDSSIRKTKGQGRPLVPQDDRARVLNALASVDSVAIFDEPTPTALLSRLRPDIWVKGDDYAARPMPEADLVRRLGGDVVLLPIVAGYSTTRLLHSASFLRPELLRQPVRTTRPQEAS
jgi:rfaE bifunctional protein nucleotidyltransferase chain/domain/rfaE bifunctional protein kinase chain/domain